MMSVSYTHLLPAVEITAASPSGQAIAEPPRTGGHVLLVDDIAMNRDVIGAFLRAAGYQVTLADNGQDGVRLASEQDFELILMDVRMPEMDGLEATRRIRALPAPRGMVPILALTAYFFPDQIAQCQDAGMNGHVAKPVDYTTLMREVANTIARRPPGWIEGESEPSRAEDTASPPRLDRTVLDQLLAFLPPEEVVANLRSLRERKEKMLELMDGAMEQTEDQRAAMSDTAHALASTAGLFGFMALSVTARRFQHAVEADSPECEALARQVHEETHAALALLDTVSRENQMQAA